ncbi:MAG: S-methyl-5-thioribose-1-phosphate isomerase [Desulfurococcales archaeon ex4484_58]|nr:MAG: S-methyl-5-thioribose-1-phosphate isomerase [Desulfurococcales archaeon ex4484_58]
MSGLKYPLKVKAVWWDEGEKRVCWINTLKLPFEKEVICSDDVERVAKAIVDMEIRGAPAIGVSAALALAAYSYKLLSMEVRDFYSELMKAIDRLWRTRPTAHNLFWALDRLKKIIVNSRESRLKPSEAVEEIEKEALSILNEDLEANIKIGEYGAELIPDNATIMTHCNAGALATAGYGTALAIVRIAWYQGKNIRVIATETRPVLQGARLTVWELLEEGIPVTLITDNMAGYIIRKKIVDLVIVGADRVTREGYVINKIGTYMIALAAKRNNIPFYVAAPTSTIDLLSTIDEVVIEERNPDEVRRIRNTYIVPENTPALNYAFDITDPDLVSGIITEKGVVLPPFHENLVKIMK